MIIKVLCEDGETYADLSSEAFAKSAIENDIDLESFSLSMDNFCDKSSSAVEEIHLWREDAAERYVTSLIEAGKITLKLTDFEGGSDYDEIETALDDIND